MEIINFAETNSLLGQYLSEMRDVNKQKDPLRFRRNLERMGQIMGYEISKTLHYKTVDIQTPLATCPSPVLDEKVVLATIFRAGVPFHQGLLSYFDYAENAFVSAYRKLKEKDSLEVLIEYLASPRLDGKTLVLCDPMLATGASMELGYRALLTKGTPAKIHVVSVIASQKAVDYIAQHFPADITTIWVGAIDPEINERSYIVPGLGDAGDLAYGIKD